MASPGPLALAGMAPGGPKINRETTEKLSRNHRGIEVPFFYFSKIWFEAHFWRDLGPSGGPGTGILGQIFIEKLSRNHRGIEVPFFFSDFGMDWPPQALWRWGGWGGRGGQGGRGGSGCVGDAFVRRWGGQGCSLVAFVCHLPSGFGYFFSSLTLFPPFSDGRI